MREKGPSRKKHKNSKLGCATCKRRRVKCPENLPACLNCIKHGSRCEYLDYTEKQLEDFARAKLAQGTESDLRRAKNSDGSRGDVSRSDLEGLLDERARLAKLHIDEKKSRDNKSESGPEQLAEQSGGGRPPVEHTFSAELVMDVEMMAIEQQHELNRLLGHLLQDHIEVQPLLMDPRSLPDSMSFDLQHDSMGGQAATGGLLPGGVLDVLNFQHNAITQNFDNLLAGGGGGDGDAPGDGTQIIYPVYSIHNSNFVTPGAVEWESDYSSSEGNGGSGSGGAADGPLVNAPLRPTGPFAAARDVFRSPEAVKLQLPLRLALAFAEKALLVSPAPPFSRASPGSALPGAQMTPRRFKVPTRLTTNYEELLFQTTAVLAPRIAKGLASLPEIRNLYHVWIGYFIYKAFKSSVMFLCLLNLTTNYLITNVFSADMDTRFDALVLLTKTRNMLLVHLIQHYATVIKGLRSLLNHHGDPEMAASVSYILSLMSIYDPGATAHSTTCFRDGMFLVLSYTLHQATRQGVDPPRLIPIHLQLMTNVARTVYLPGYGTLFLYEFESMYARFGAILDRAEKCLPQAGSNLALLKKKYNELLLFSKDAIRHHLPALDSHMDDIEYQEDVLFTMFNRWSKLQPPRFLVATSRAEGLEKVLNLFYRVFRKAIFAVVPQVRFLFLRDFDSPLMLDVFANYNTATILEELKDSTTASIAHEVYQELVPELQYLAAYCVRLITFLTLRTTILYRNLVYEERVRELIPIYNVVEWRKSITNIEVTRQDFHELIGLLEYPITSFKDTYMTHSHYPQIVDPQSPGAKLATPKPPDNDGADGQVDMLSLQPHGLLKHDVFPEI